MMNSSTNRFLIGASLASGTSAFEDSYSSDRVGAFDEDQAIPVLEVSIEDPIQVHLKNDKCVQRVVHLGNLNLAELAELPEDADLITEIEHDVIVDASFNGSRVSVSELLPCLTTVGGTVQINGNNNLLFVDLSGLSTVGSSVQINNNAALKFIDLSNINVVGAVQVLLNPALVSIYTIDLFAGGLHVDDGVTQCSQEKEYQGTLDLASLPTDAHLITKVIREATGHKGDVIANSDFTGPIDFAADLPCLREIGRNFTVEKTKVTSINTGILQKTGLIYFNDNNMLESFDMSSLLQTARNVDIYRNDHLVSFDMSSLQSAGHDISIRNNPALTNFNLPSLQSVAGRVSIGNNFMLSNADMASLQSVGGCVSISWSMLSNINLPSLESASSIFIENNQDLQAVDLRELLNNNQSQYGIDFRFGNNPSLEEVRLDSYCCEDIRDCERYVPDVDVEFPTDCGQPQM